MRTLALPALAVLASTAAAENLPTAPSVPASLAIDTSKLVMSQPRAAAPKDKLLCRMGDDSGCKIACDGGSATSCSRLGWTLAMGGADNPLLPTTKFEQDFKGAEAPFEKACKLGFHPSCVDVQLVRQKIGKKVDTAQLQASCNAGYGRACSLLAESVPEAQRLALYERGCNGGDGEACLVVSDSKQDLKEQLAWARKAFFTPTKGKVPLTCPAGMQASRTVSSITFAWTLYTPKWACGRYDEARRRFVENGPFIELSSEEDEAVYPYGIVSKKGTMKDGQPDGLVERWNARGDLIASTTFQAGREHGVSTEFMRGRDGSVESVTQVTYVLGKREGTYRHILMPEEDLARLETGEYKAGEKVGTWIEVRIKSRRVIEVERYVAGKLEGEREEYDDRDGSFVGSTTYVAGKPTKGTRYVKGKKTEEILYGAKGRRSEVRELDPQGKAKRIRTYDDDGDRISTKIKNKRGAWVDDPDGY